MARKEESMAEQVEYLREMGKWFSYATWLAWVECALVIGIALYWFGDLIPHWSIYALIVLFYALFSRVIWLAARTLRVIVYIFDELRLVV